PNAKNHTAAQGRSAVGFISQKIKTGAALIKTSNKLSATSLSPTGARLYTIRVMGLRRHSHSSKALSIVLVPDFPAAMNFAVAGKVFIQGAGGNIAKCKCR